MGDALDDYYDRLDRLDSICPIHNRMYDGAADCPDCDDEHYEALTEKDSQ